jgi:hypothetical protein
MGGNPQSFLTTPIGGNLPQWRVPVELKNGSEEKYFAHTKEITIWPGVFQ